MQHKRQDVMHYVENMSCDIILLQDTHLIKQKVSVFNDLWSGKAYHSCYSSKSRGSTILIRAGLQHKVLSEFTSKQGNYIMILCQIGTDSYVIGSIYGPNRDEPQFYEEIDRILESVDCDHIVLGGDFNFIMNAEYDCHGYVRENNVQARNKFISVCNKHNMVDIWRHLNPTKQQYTWHTAAGDKAARLDMFFISNHLASHCSDLLIEPGYRTDHSIITMFLQTRGSEKGPGLWKFNESLLNDEKYIEIVINCISKTIEQYALPIYTREFISVEDNYENIHFRINDDLFYETLLMMIRGETVRYSKIRARQRRTEEKELTSQITAAHAKFSCTKSETDATVLRTLNEQLEEMRRPMIDGLIIRSRAKWHEDGERSSRYFLSLEKRNAMRKTITSLTVDDHRFTQTSSILHKFSEDLSRKYSKAHELPLKAKQFISKNVSMTLNENEREALEQPLSFKELTDSLNKMKKGKSPGSNGYTASFFRYFWKQLGPFLHRAFVFLHSEWENINDSQGRHHHNDT